MLLVIEPYFLGRLETHHVHRNPAFEFAQGRRRPPLPKTASPMSSDDLTNMYNRLKLFHPEVHPRTDIKDGGMHIEWSRDMYFLLFGHQMYADPFGIRRSPHATTGAPWPLPKRYARNEGMIFRVDKYNFEIRTDAAGCDIIDEAINRYTKRIVLNSLEDMYDNLQHAEATTLNDPQGKYSTDLYTNAPVISHLNVYVKKPCKGVMYPSLTSDESCEYRVIITFNNVVKKIKLIFKNNNKLKTNLS